MGVIDNLLQVWPEALATNKYHNTYIILFYSDITYFRVEVVAPFAVSQTATDTQNP